MVYLGSRKSSYHLVPSSLFKTELLNSRTHLVLLQEGKTTHSHICILHEIIH